MKHTFDGEKNNSIYFGIDVMKFLMCMLVVCLHVRPFGAEEYPMAAMILYQYIARIAVPFFFVTSSYFLFCKLDEKALNVDNCVKYIWRFVRLYLIWSLIYFVPAFETLLYRTKGEVIQAVFLYIQQFF